MANHSAVLTALADPTRRTIFERLAEEPSSVGELAQGLPVSRPAVSQHLKVLKAAGLVSDTAHGTRRVYAVDRAGLGRHALDDRVRRDAAPSRRAAGVRPRPVAAIRARRGLSGPALIRIGTR